MVIRILVVALLLTQTIPVLAGDLSNAKKKALADLVARCETAVQDRNCWVLGAAVPPRVLKRYVAARADPDLKRDLWIPRVVADPEKIDRQLGNLIEAFKL